jgi:hypothetical protein
LLVGVRQVNVKKDLASYYWPYLLLAVAVAGLVYIFVLARM